MERLLLLGYFGAGNFGDDALLADWLIANYQWLERERLIVDVTAAGDADPLAGFAESEVLREIFGKPIPKQQVLGAPTHAFKALLAPGGSLLQDVTSVRSLLYYLWVIRRFLRAGKPVFLLNQGIGPLNSWLAEFLTPRYLSRVRLLTMRDTDSYHWARRHRRLAQHPELHLACDPLLMPRLRLLGDLAAYPALKSAYALIIPKLTGDLPHPGEDTTEAQAMARLIDHTARTTGLRPLLLPLHEEQDLGFCREIRQRYEHCELLDLTAHAGQRHSAVLAAIGGAHLVISHRLHGLVTAVARGVPALGVAYDPKIVSFCNEIGLPYCFPATVHESTTLMDLDRLWQNRREVLEVMTERHQQMLARLGQAEERFHALW